MDGLVSRVGERAPVHFATTPEPEADHLERWKAHWLRQEQDDGEQQMRYEAMLQRDAEALQLEEEEEEHARLAAADAGGGCPGNVPGGVRVGWPCSRLH